MVFSSFPSIYLDHPNLQQFQQEQQHHQVGSDVGNSQIQPPPHPPPAGTVPAGGGVVGGAPLFGGSSIRPGSMVDRARVAKLPLPEAGLKCPRCDSSNTKFCYFNNYNLSQPRHFCKTCRRYWTRGGALRNVPVGGGCRRNKKTKSSSTSSKSSNVVTSSEQKHEMGANNNTDMSMTSSTGMQLPFMAALHNLNHQYAAVTGGGGHMGFSLGGAEAAWRLPTTAIGGYEPLTSNLFPFQEINGNEASSNPMNIGDHDQHLIGNFGTSSSDIKSEENPAMNSTKQFHISSDNIGQFWNSGNPWSSSSTSHLL